MSYKTLLVVCTLVIAAQAAPGSITGGTNANTIICKALAQKGCKGVGIRGDECCPNSGLWCNTAAPSTCSKCRVCVFGEKQTTACGATSNTVCTPCPNPGNVVEYFGDVGTSCKVKTCKPGFYNKGEAEGCLPCDTCVSGSTYQTTQCDTLANRVCTTCSRCTDGLNYQTSACNILANTVCTTCSSCSAGTYPNGGCVTTTAGGVDRICPDCPNKANAKTYADPGKSCVVEECKAGFYYKSEAEGCVACDTCVDGTSYQTTQCSTKSNRVCTTCSSCTDGSNYQTSACNILANTVCTTCSSCSAGTYPNGGCVTTTAGGVDRICPDCPNKANAKTYADPGKSCVVEECKAGFYYKSEAEGCVACADSCVDGTSYESTQCTTKTNRVCSTCQECNSEAAGTYGTYTNGGCKTTESGGVDRICTPCSTCGENSYETTSCSADHNRVCTTCTGCDLGNSYETAACTPTSNRVCSACSTCSGGSTYETSACTLTSNRVCSACTTCTAGKYQTADCTVTADRQCATCKTCATGYHSAGGCAGTSDRSCEADEIIITSSGPTNPDCGNSCSNCQTCEWSDATKTSSVCKNIADRTLCSSGTGYCSAGTCVTTPTCTSTCSECTSCQWSNGVGSAGACKAANEDRLCSSNAGFCSSGICRIPVASCATVTTPGCNTLCHFEINNGVKGASSHCRYVKNASGGYAANAPVCGNNSVCNQGNCNCDPSNTLGGGRKMLHAY